MTNNLIYFVQCKLDFTFNTCTYAKPWRCSILRSFGVEIVKEKNVFDYFSPRNSRASDIYRKDKKKSSGTTVVSKSFS